MVKNRVRSAKFLVNLYVLANFKTACISIVELNHGISFILPDTKISEPVVAVCKISIYCWVFIVGTALDADLAVLRRIHTF